MASVKRAYDVVVEYSESEHMQYFKPSEFALTFICEALAKGKGGEQCGSDMTIYFYCGDTDAYRKSEKCDGCGRPLRVSPRAVVFDSEGAESNDITVKKYVMASMSVTGNFKLTTDFLFDSSVEWQATACGKDITFYTRQKGYWYHRYAYTDMETNEYVSARDEEEEEEEEEEEGCYGTVSNPLVQGLGLHVVEV